MHGCSGLSINKQYWSADLMSLCVAYIDDGCVYICSDSRSSTPDDNSGTNIFSKQPNKFRAIIDDYRKIIRLPIKGRQIVGFSTRANMFNGMTISEIISSVEYLCDESTLKCLVRVLEFISAYECETTVDLFEYVGKELVWVSGNSDHGNISIKSKHYPLKSLDYVYSGPDWARSLLSTNTYSNYETESKKVLDIANMFENAKIISSKLENTIGGVVHIGKLTPEGFEWLQNGYKL